MSYESLKDPAWVMYSFLWLTVKLGQKRKTHLSPRCSELLLDGWNDGWMNELIFGFLNLSCLLVTVCLHLCSLLSEGGGIHGTFQCRIHRVQLSVCCFSVALGSMKPRPAHYLTVHGAQLYYGGEWKSRVFKVYMNEQENRWL